MLNNIFARQSDLINAYTHVIHPSLFLSFMLRCWEMMINISIFHRHYAMLNKLFARQSDPSSCFLLLFFLHIKFLVKFQHHSLSFYLSLSITIGLDLILKSLLIVMFSIPSFVYDDQEKKMLMAYLPMKQSSSLISETSTALKPFSKFILFKIFVCVLNSVVYFSMLYDSNY